MDPAFTYGISPSLSITSQEHWGFAGQGGENVCDEAVNLDAESLGGARGGGDELCGVAACPWPKGGREGNAQDEAEPERPAAAPQASGTWAGVEPAQAPQGPPPGLLSRFLSASRGFVALLRAGQLHYSGQDYLVRDRPGFLSGKEEGGGGGRRKGVFLSR